MLKNRMVKLLCIMLAIICLFDVAYAKQETKKFKFSKFMKCDTMVKISDGGNLTNVIKSKKTTWLELKKGEFDVYLWKYEFGPDTQVRKAKAKCIGETKIEWKGLSKGTYYLYFEKERDGQLLEGTVTYQY